MIKFSIITLFPEALAPYLSASMMWKAAERGIAEFNFVNLREFGLGPHRSVDDTPYGGGDGMLLRPEPVFAAVESVLASDPSAKVMLPTPVGQLWTQELARHFASLATSASPVTDITLSPATPAPTPSDPSEPSSASPSAETPAPAPAESTSALSVEPGSSSAPLHLIIICPHYEGYDERILSLVDYPISLGHYILTGGELPALIIIDSIVRLLPGVLGGETSALVESFSDGDNLEYPQYTKPANFRGIPVPEVLLSGNHGAIAKWRADHSRHAE